MVERDQTEQHKTIQDAHVATLRPYPGVPNWVKVLGVITVVLILLVGIILLTGGHGPNRHLPSGSDPSGQTTPAIEHKGQ